VSGMVPTKGPEVETASDQGGRDMAQLQILASDS
jgi:hypothetical protein